MTNTCPNCESIVQASCDTGGGAYFYCPSCRTHWKWESWASCDTDSRQRIKWEEKETPTSS